MKTLKGIKKALLKALTIAILAGLLIVSLFNVNIAHAETIAYKYSCTVVHRCPMEFKSINR